jgi:hypothetical protein
VSWTVLFSATAGVLLGAGLSASAWIFAAAAQVRVHDAQILEVADLLEHWASGRAVKLANDRQAAMDDANARGALSSGARIGAELALRNLAGDEAEREFITSRARRGQILASEDFRHRYWRWLWKQKPPNVLSATADALRAHRTPVDLARATREPSPGP